MPSISTIEERPQVKVVEERPAVREPVEEPVSVPQGAVRKVMSGVEGALSAIGFTIGVAAVSFAIGLISAPDGSRVRLGVDLLKRGPFEDYLVLGILLLVLVGGSMLGSSVLVLAGHKRAWQASLIAGLVMIAWVSTRVAIMGLGSLLEPIAFSGGAAMVALALRLRWESSR
jgi:hypothetical protein